MMKSSNSTNNIYNTELGVVIEAHPEISQDVTKRSNYQENNQQQQQQTSLLNSDCKNSSQLDCMSLASNSRFHKKQKSMDRINSSCQFEDTNKLLNMHQYDIIKSSKRSSSRGAGSCGGSTSKNNQNLFRLRKTPSQRKSLVTDEMILLNQDLQNVTCNIDLESNSVTNFIHNDDEREQDCDQNFEQKAIKSGQYNQFQNQINDQTQQQQIKSNNNGQDQDEYQCHSKFNTIENNCVYKLDIVDQRSKQQVSSSSKYEAMNQSNQKQSKQQYENSGTRQSLSRSKKKKKTPLRNGKLVKNDQENQSPFGITNYFKTIQSLTGFNRNLGTLHISMSQYQHHQKDNDLTFPEHQSNRDNNYNSNNFTLRERKSSNTNRLICNNSSINYQTIQANDNKNLVNTKSAKQIICQSQSMLQAYKAFRKSQERISSIGKSSISQTLAQNKESKKVNKSMVMNHVTNRNSQAINVNNYKCVSNTTNICNKINNQKSQSRLNNQSVINSIQTQQQKSKSRTKTGVNIPSHKKQNHSISSLSNISLTTGLSQQQSDRNNQLSLNNSKVAFGSKLSYQPNTMQQTQIVNTIQQTGASTKTIPVLEVNNEDENINSKKVVDCELNESNISTKPVTTNNGSFSLISDNKTINTNLIIPSNGRSSISNVQNSSFQSTNYNHSNSNSQNQNNNNNNNQYNSTLLSFTNISTTSKTNLISQGLKEKSTIINAKNELLLHKNQEKKDLTQQIAQMKKDIQQMHKYTKGVKGQNAQIASDIVKLNTLVSSKGTKKVQSNKEILMLRKDVRQLEKESDDMRNLRKQLDLQLMAEFELLEAVSQMVLNYKKQLNDVRKDKERLVVQVKQSQKQMESLAKRKSTLADDSNKLLLDFQDTMHQQTEHHHMTIS